VCAGDVEIKAICEVYKIFIRECFVSGSQITEPQTSIADEVTEINAFILLKCQLNGRRLL
jgi:hypothetical protein